MTFAEELKQARKGLGWTQADLADCLSTETDRTTVTVISRWENGHNAPRHLTQQGIWALITIAITRQSRGETMESKTK